MGRNGLMGSFQGLDAFGKTMEDVKIKTRTGAMLTFISFSIIFASVMLEFIDYRRINVEPSIEVDRSRGEKLVIEVDITFPRVPCYLLSLDVMDISGDQIMDLSHEITKTRIHRDGYSLETLANGQLKSEVEMANVNKDPNYCGSCYGGEPPENGCCNTCEQVRESYVRKGWSFTNPEGIEQCVDEGWIEKVKEQNEEGCRLAGRVGVNKVIGNLQFSPGKSFQNNLMQIHELVPYLKDNNHHDFGHIINQLRFAADEDDYTQAKNRRKEMLSRGKLGMLDPLNGVRAHTEESDYMFQYFLKVVSTDFVYLNGDHIPTHQYSVTEYQRDLTLGNAPSRDAHGHMTSHGVQGVPGVFINYEISPMKIIHSETRQSFAHFLTSTCAIVGGVLTVAGLVDSFIFAGSKKLSGNSGDGYAGPGGKML